MSELLKEVPDEFYNWVHKVKVNLEAKYKIIESEVLQVSKMLVKFESRKDQAVYLQERRPHLLSMVFSKLDGSERYKELIWKGIRPEFSKPFIEE